MDSFSAVGFTFRCIDSGGDISTPCFKAELHPQVVAEGCPGAHLQSGSGKEGARLSLDIELGQLRAIDDVKGLN